MSPLLGPSPVIAVSRRGIIGGIAPALVLCAILAELLDIGHVSALRPTVPRRRRPRLLYVWSLQLRQQPPQPVRAEDIREEDLPEEDIREVEVDEETVVVTEEAEEMEVTAVAEGEVAVEDEGVVEAISRLGRVLLGLPARLTIGT